MPIDNLCETTLSEMRGISYDLEIISIHIVPLDKPLRVSGKPRIYSAKMVCAYVGDEIRYFMQKPLRPLVYCAVRPERGSMLAGMYSPVYEKKY